MAQRRRILSDNLKELLLLVALAAAVRAIFFELRGDYLDWDEALYLLIARNINEGAGLTLNGHPHTALGPFVPYATALVSRVTGHELMAAHRLLVIAAGALLIPPFHYLARLHAGKKVATLASILLIGWPALIDVAPKLGPMWRHMYAGTEPVFLALLFGSLALGELGIRRPGPSKYLIFAFAGLLLGCGFLTRPESAVIGVLYLGVRGIRWFRSEKIGDVAVAATVAALTFILVVAPYLNHVRNATGSWTPSGKLAPTRMSGDLYQKLVRNDRHMGAYLRVWWALEPGHAFLLNPYWGARSSLPDEQRLSDFGRALDAEWPRSVDGGSRAFERLTVWVRSLGTLAGPIYFLLSILGLVASRGSLRRTFPPFVVTGIVASSLTALTVFAMPRFFLYLVPVFAMWSAEGIIGLSQLALRRGRRIRELPMALGFMVVGLLVAASGTASGEAEALRGLALGNRVASERLGEALPANSPVIAWHPRLAYWAELDWRPLPVAPLAATVHYALERDVRYLFLAQGMYTPIELTASYVVFEIDPTLSDAFPMATNATHDDPSITLESQPPIAGFLAGRVLIASPEAAGASDGI